MAAPEPKQNTPKTLAEIAVMYNVTEKEIVEYSAEDLQELLTVEFSLDPGVAESITSEVQEKGGNLVYVDPQYTPAGAVMDYITLEEENAERRAAFGARVPSKLLGGVIIVVEAAFAAAVIATHDDQAESGREEAGR